MCVPDVDFNMLIMNYGKRIANGACVCFRGTKSKG
jgi:hypothetical protein